MKTKTMKALGAAVALSLGMGGPFPVLAIGIDESLGEEATATDAFTFRCPPPAVSARANVEDLPPNNTPARMRVMLAKGGGAAQVTDVDPAPAGEGLASPPSPSPYAVLVKGPGLYLAVFLKTASGPENYRGSVDCRTDGGKSSDPEDWTNVRDND